LIPEESGEKFDKINLKKQQKLTDRVKIHIGLENIKEED